MKSPNEMTDAEFIQIDAGWPQYPMLPVKRRQSNEVGIIMAGKKTRVWMANLWAIDEALPLDYLDYDSVDAVVADGWVVD